MNNIFKIFINDLKTISRNIIVFIVTIGISILPALYSWFNIAASWDPYSSTGGIAFAVCSKDKGYSYKVLSINAGDEIVSNLKQNDKMGWDFVNEEEALEGVENGKYYAAVIIPENFSENLFSITTGEFEQATLKYYCNEKKNAIAPKMTNAGIQTVENTVKSTYVGTATQLIATSLNLTTDDLSDTKDKVADKITDTLEKSKTEIDSFKKTVNVFISTLDTIDGLVKTNKEMLPTVQQSLANAGVYASDIKGSIQSTQNAASQITSSIESILDSTSTYADSMQSHANEAFQEISKDSASAAEKLRKITEYNEKIISINTRIISMFQTIQNDLGVDCSGIIQKLENANDHQNDLIETINNAADTIKKTGKLPQNIQSNITSMISQTGTDLSSISSAFKGIRQRIDNAVTKSYSALDKVSDFLQGLSGDVPELESTFDNASDTIGSMKKTFEDLKTFMDDAKTKVDDTIKRINELKDNDTIENLISPIIENPQALGGFVASPVTTETVTVHPIENYGSAMTPFYTSLGIWVGGIILIAVTRVELTKKQLSRLHSPNSTELYIGRYLIFFFYSQIQSLIIALGDLFFLKIQCNSIGYFILASLVSGFVFSLIIYSLTITFNVIGKALAVIILVVQVAGSGGTFPIEVLPQPFQVISPYLPFRYSNDAFREAVAGPDPAAYWHNILLLLAFVPFALVLGILLRKPCIKLMQFFDKQIHQSELVI